MKYQAIGAVLLGMALLASPARAGLITINFDDLGNLATVTNQYAGVAFSAGGGDLVLTINLNSIANQNPPYLGSAPNLICTGPSGGTVADCTHDLILTFTSPVDNLTFNAFGNRTFAPGQFAQVDVFQGAASTLNIPLFVSHTTYCASPILDCAPDPQSLNFLGITKVVIHNNTDPNGSAYDDFTFTTQASATPEPSTFLLMGFSGLVLAAGNAFRRRRTQQPARRLQGRPSPLP